MNQLTTNLIPLAVLFAAMLILVGRMRRAMRAAARSKQRVVERPNSHYGPQGQPRPRVNPWKGIELERVHELNRVEVERLSARVDALGPETLSPSERTFLDQFLGPQS